MICLILVAGYATRLYPLTENNPKSLLEIAGKTILQHILEKVERVSSIDTVCLVSNARFIDQFESWVKAYPTRLNIEIVNDGSTTNENRLGAVGDIQLAISRKKINEPVLVLAGDNLFDFELADFVNFHHNVNTSCITVHELKDEQQLRRTGVAELNNEGKVISFEEKPVKPRSNLAVPPFYIYTEAALRLFERYLEEGNNADAPGYFIPWLINREEVYAYKFSGQRYDIGTIDSYESTRKLFEKEQSSIGISNRGEGGLDESG